VGFMERPERLVLLIIGGLFNRMGPVLWVIAVVSTITVIHRIIFTWQETRAGRTLPGINLCSDDEAISRREHTPKATAI
jgi:hypothetical protein